LDSYKVVKSEKTYDGLILDVTVDTLTMPHGGEALRETVLHNGGSAILPVDNEGNVILVRQYRHSAKNFVLEIPAGIRELNEDPYDCAMRELEEETGCKAEKLSFLTAMYSAIGFCSEVIYIYYADKLSPGMQKFDHDEFIELEKHPLEKAVEMVFNGDIRDSKTIAAIFMYQHIATEQKFL